MPAKLTSPLAHQMIQKDKDGLASFDAKWDGSANGVRLMDGVTVVAESRDGSFKGIPEGIYRLELLSDGAEVDAIPVGVGDVILILGKYEQGDIVRRSNGRWDLIG